MKAPNNSNQADAQRRARLVCVVRRHEQREKMNRWGIPTWLEEEVKARDKNCIYCGVRMIEKAPQCGSRKHVATWEHIINDARLVTRENIARCCSACNSSKGTKILADWLQSNYCKKNGISEDTVAKVVKVALDEAGETDA